MRDDFETRAMEMAKHSVRAAAQTEEFEEQALAADRQVRALKGAGLLEEAERYGTAELARLHLAFVRLGAEFEGHAQQLLGMKRHSHESLGDFMGRVNERLADTGRQLGKLADLLEGRDAH